MGFAYDVVWGVPSKLDDIYSKVNGVIETNSFGGSMFTTNIF